MKKTRSDLQLNPMGLEAEVNRVFNIFNRSS